MNEPSKIKPTPFLDCREEREICRNDLPHWHQYGRLQFITWCLGDALPAKAMKRLKHQKEMWLMMHPKPWDPREEAEYFDRYEDRINRWLNAGRGESVFRQRSNADLLAKTLMFHEGKKTRMDAFVIMPNHVHCLVQLVGDCAVSSLMHSWRSYSAQTINRKLGRKGPLWGRDYWDRIIRSPEHYWHVRRYIQNNPAKAKLSENQTLLWTRDPPLWDTLKEEGYETRAPWGEIT